MNILSDSPTEKLAARLEGVKQTHNGFTCRCPAHEDRHACLSVSAGKGGLALVYCHAGCSTPDVLDAIGLGQADLFPADLPRNGYAQNGYHANGHGAAHNGKTRNGKARNGPNIHSTHLSSG